MLTVALVCLGVGFALGGSVGFRVGRGYERIRPRRDLGKGKTGKKKNQK